MTKISRIGIGILVLSIFVSTAIAGTQGLIEPNITKDMNKETPVWKLDQNADVRVIITLKDAVADEKIQGLKNKIGDFKVESKRWNKVYPNGFAATVKKKQFDQLLEDTSIEKVDIDKKFYTQIDTANYWSGVTKARAIPPTGYNVTGDRNELPYNYTKDDVVIAILDTGIDPKHTDLTGTDNGGTEKIIGWADVLYGSLSPYDDNGHGTAVASIAAGEGDSDPNYKGVAPGAALVGVKVLYYDGWGYESDIITGINWVVDTKGTYGTKIMSLSLNAAGSSDGTDPISVALNNAINNGIVVVVSSGNSGPQKYTIGSPGATSQAITVGAIADVGYLLQALPDSAPTMEVKPPKPKGNMKIQSGPMTLRDNGFYLAPFSARGPTADNKIKPDIVAPGVAIMSAQSIYPNADYHGGYTEYTGTSMSAPFVAGVAALMLDAKYTLSPIQIKNIIRSTGEEYGPSGCDIDYGCGRIRAYKAVGNASTGSIPTGDQWVPTHLRYTLQMNDITSLKKYPMSITDNNYPVASTLIMRDWSGYNTGIDLGMFLNDPLGNQIAYVNDWWPRQETFTVKTDYKGTYNLSVFKAQSGSGYYNLDISKR